MSSRKKLQLRKVEALTKNQKGFFVSFDKGKHCVLSGSAGVGKTFIALYKALEKRRKIILIRSAVCTRDMGYLPGTKEEKESAYISPYKHIVKSLYNNVDDVWDRLVNQKEIHFMTTSYIRGLTISDATVIVDESQNCNFHELCSIITRMGNNTQLIICGDYYQSDLRNSKEQEGILKFTNILDTMTDHFDHIKFDHTDIVRSDLVRDFIIAKDTYEKR